MYDFLTLSPDDFERLVGDLFSAEWGAQLEAFKVGADGGIDLRHSRVKVGEDVVTVQCKRYGPNQFRQLVTNLKKSELAKIRKLKPKRYVLVTSLPLSAHQKRELLAMLTPWCKSSADIYGKDELNGMLRRHAAIERSHFKLWISSTAVLERILHARIFNLTEDTIDSLNEQVSRLVQHPGVTDALQRLHEFHHILVVGNPGIGKTTLARMLLCHYLTQRFEPVVVDRSVGDVWTVLSTARKSGAKTVILYDDFLGQVAFGKDKFEKNEEKSLFQLFDAVRKTQNIRLVLTTREYILEDARRLYAEFDRRIDELHRYTLSIDSYAMEHRARILYNHLFFSDLPLSRLQKIVKDRVYRQIVSHTHFNPRTIESVSKLANSQSMSDGDYINFVKQQFDDPSRIWGHAFENEISAVSRHVLVALWSFGSEVEAEVLRNATQRLMEKTSGIAEFDLQFRNALKELGGNFVRIRRIKVVGGEGKFVQSIGFQNPSVQESIERFLVSHPAWMKVIVSNAVSFAQIDHLVRLATETRIRSARVTIPQRIVLLTESWQALEISVEANFERPDGQFIHYSGSKDPVYQERGIVSLARRMLVWGQIVRIAWPERALTETILKYVSTKDGWMGVLQGMARDNSEASAVARLVEWLGANDNLDKAVLLQCQTAFREACIDFLSKDEWLWIDGVSDLVSDKNLVAFDSDGRLKAAIEESIERETENLLNSDADVGVLEGECDALEKVGKEWGIDVVDHASSIRRRIQSMLEESPSRDDGYEDERYSLGLTRDFDVDGLFATLTAR